MSFPSSAFGYSPYNPTILSQPRSSLSPGSTASNNSSAPPNNNNNNDSSPKSPSAEAPASSVPASTTPTVVSSPVASPSAPPSEASSSSGGGRLGGGPLSLSPAVAAASAAAAASLGPGYPPAGSYPSSEQNPYPSIAMDSSYFGALGAPYASKDAAEMNAAAAAWSAGAIPPTACYYSYDHPSLAAYGYGGGYDLAARRKNATRESTATLKAWLNEHKKNPYPTKGEKIMLAIITKMTLTQVSTWFANARRRLKKENKMTWEPKNKLDDEDVDISDDEEKDREDEKTEEDKLTHLVHEDPRKSSGIPLPPSKPKIWSLADTAVCKTPPPVVGPAAAAMAGLIGWNASPYAHSPVRPLSAFSRSFGLPRPGDFFGHPPGLPTSSSSSSSNQDPSSADTPPHTPPNLIKHGLLGAAAGLHGLSYLSSSAANGGPPGPDFNR